MERDSSVDLPQNPLVNRIAIVGVGLMGGSLGLALRANRVAQTVVGFDNAATIFAACAMGAIHEGSASLAEAVDGADIVFIATPIHRIREVIANLAPIIGGNTTVSDLGSVKTGIDSYGHALLGDRFLGGHPMAGSESTGIHAARASLYAGAAWALTPVNNTPTPNDRTAALCKVIQRIGAKPLVMSADRHDRAAALVSHLPHLISFAYNHTVEKDAERELAHALAAGSYRDLTRVAASDPILWRDVFIENREWLLAALNAYRSAIIDLETAVLTENPDDILSAITRASQQR